MRHSSVEGAPAGHGACWPASTWRTQVTTRGSGWLSSQGVRIRSASDGWPSDSAASAATMRPTPGFDRPAIASFSSSAFESAFFPCLARHWAAR